MCFYDDLETIEENDPKIEKSEIHSVFARINKGIHRGFRKMPVNDFTKCSMSVFFLHNETYNIWSHLLPIPFFIYLTYCDLKNPFFNWEEKFLMAISTFFGVICFSGSVIYHTFRCNNLWWYHATNVCDQYCIILVVGMGNFLYSYFCLYCTNMKWCFIVVNILCVSFMMLKSKWLAKQSFFFLCFFHLSFSFMTLIAQQFGLRVLGYEEREEYFNVSLFWIYFLLITAVLTRAFRFPERLVPYMFDYFGASHPNFHVMAVIALYIGNSTMREFLNEGLRNLNC